MIRTIIKFALNVFFTIFFRIEKRGQENIPKDGAYIIAPKHLSNWDPPVVVARTKRNDVYVLAKQELFINRFVKYIAKKVHALPVKRNSQDTSVVKESVRVLKQGHILLLFPEGTRNGIEKHGKIHSGAVIMANMAKVPVIPVGIQATYKPFSKVIINYGKPIDLGEKKLSKEEIEEVTKKLQDDIMELTNGGK